MIKRAEKPSAYIEVIPARPEQEPILANLLELYAHDFSELMLLFSRGRLEEEVLIIEAKIDQGRDGLHLGAVDVAVGVQ
jgi:hypothetical protein